MTRFDYLGGRERGAPGGRSLIVAIDQRILGPLTALGATVCLTVTGCAIQLARLHAAQHAYAAASAQLAALHEPVERVARLRSRIVVAADVVAVVAASRRANLAHANEFASIGNRLPSDAWLRSLRYENGRYELAGVASAAATVGTAIEALRGPARDFTPHLVSLRASTDDGIARVHYTVRVEPVAR
jgi:Tfp pilus assembly protein PilN